MKRILCSLILFTPTSLSFTASGGEEITLTGKGCGATCCLKIAEECQSVLSVDKDGKKTTYFIEQNEL